MWKMMMKVRGRGREKRKAKIPFLLRGYFLPQSLLCNKAVLNQKTEAHGCLGRWVVSQKFGSVVACSVGYTVNYLDVRRECNKDSVKKNGDYTFRGVR